MVIETEDRIILLVNVYAPPEKNERDFFWSHLHKDILKIKQELQKNNSQNKPIETIMGGGGLQCNN